MAAGYGSEIVTRVKGDRVSSTFGAVTTIMDGPANQITLLNPAAKRYATVAMADYPGNLSVPEAMRKVFQDLKIDVQTKKTGRAGMVNGIRADEYEMVLSFEPIGLKMILQQWMANPEESNRIPAMLEFAGYSARVQSQMNYNSVMEKVFAQFPGMGDKFRQPLEELRRMNSNMVLKMQLAAYMPGMAEALGADASAPLFEVSMSLTELSGGAIPDSAFLAPAGFEAAPLDDLVKAAMPVQSLLPGQ